MKLLLSGYFGYDNAGDEAVLAAMLEALGNRLPSGAQFTVTSGNPARTIERYNTPACRVAAIPRQDPATLARAIGQCDLFISGGGSLLQDVTSLRNVVYYTTLIRVAHLMGKPVMIYAQGVGPLRRGLSRRLARAAMQRARVITLRDDASAALLREIGVTRDIEVTADPVWALQPEAGDDATPANDGPVWAVCLRDWPRLHQPGAPAHAHLAPLALALAAAARQAGARLRFLPMQPAVDGPLAQALAAECGPDVMTEVVPTEDMHPRRIMAAAGRCDLMIAMRLHALIFAAAQGVPCVALNYDPKVAALAKLIGAPLVNDVSPAELARLPEAIANVRPTPATVVDSYRQQALRNADLAASVV